MQTENLAYALIQVIHNFGAAAVVGGAFFALKTGRGQTGLHRRLAWLVLVAWGAQGASGAAFGATSFYYYGELPDLHATALAALAIKVLCAIGGLILAALYLRNASLRDETYHRRTWHTLSGLGATALTAAAFLRWFS